MTKFRKIAAFGAGSELKDLLLLMSEGIELVAIGDNDTARHGHARGGATAVRAAELDFGIRRAAEGFLTRTPTAATFPLPDFSGSIVVMKP